MRIKSSFHLTTTNISKLYSSFFHDKKSISHHRLCLVYNQKFSTSAFKDHLGSFWTVHSSIFSPSVLSSFPLLKTMFFHFEVSAPAWVQYCELELSTILWKYMFFVFSVCLTSSGLMRDSGMVMHCSGRQRAFLVLPSFVRSGHTQPATTMGLCGRFNVLFSDCCGSLGAHNDLI